MARRYSRDNRGRFASGGTGATARGGRLRTAAGNKRATQTTKAAAAKPSGTVAGKVKRNPAAAGKIGQAKAAKAARFSASETAQRKTRAGQLKAMPKDLRRADRTARLAQREVMATNGAVGGNVIGRRKSSTQSKINSIREGLMRAKGDKTGSIRNQVVKEAKALRARMQTTGAGPRTGAQSGIKRRTARAAAPKNTTANRTGQINAKRAARTAAKPKTQKERWASRSAMLSNAAAKNEAKAKRMFDATTNTDTAFNTQPGRLPGRARMNAQTERSFKLQEKAAQQRSRAANLERMANTNKGDAAKRRATRADVIKNSHKGLKKGDTVEGTLYGAREVVKVNAKSVTVKGGVKNFTIPWEQIKPKQ